MTQASINKAIAKDNRRDQRLVSRLIGMETEYATLILDHPELSRQDLPASKAIYEAICEAIRKEQPTAAGLFDPEQMFLASGGAVTFESHPAMHAMPGGLIEVATPEVRSPSELLACQRSIDAMVEESAARIDMDIDLRTLKNSSDALGHIYGCQENYETIVASGIWLVMYRLSICLLWVLQLISMLVSVPILGCVLMLVFVFRFFRAGIWKLAKDPNEMFELVPSWISGLVLKSLRIVHLPTILFLRFVARHLAFRPQRKYLTAMLVSRPSICGSGSIDHDGHYWTSVKAMATDKVADMGGFSGERPIFVYGHWLGLFCARSFLSIGSTLQMFGRRQRLQIGLSDSNLSDLAEYVKIGSVSLLLDMIEAGHTKRLPVIKKPIRALHDLTADWNLVARVRTNRGLMSAIEIQKEYLKAAKQYVDSVSANRRGEAPLVLQRWGELLDCVIAYRKDANDIERSIGSVDWLTKRWMMDELGPGASWAEKKKIDLRYHELSPDGYFRQLLDEKPELQLTDDEQISRRRRSPPPTSPAARRGWLIREFAGSGENIQTEWTHAFVGRGRNRKRVEFVERS